MQEGILCVCACVHACMGRIRCWVEHISSLTHVRAPASPRPIHTPQVMQSLWALLRPQPGGKSQALAAMTLLGKLGGRNRRWLQQPVPLEYKKDPEHGLRWAASLGLHSTHTVWLEFRRMCPTGPSIQTRSCGLSGAN